MLLDYARSTSNTNLANNLVLKAALLSGATKELPKNAAYLWSQTPNRPLDPQMGAGLYNIKNSYFIIQQPQGLADLAPQDYYGWDLSNTQDILPREYHFELSHPGRFMATLCWHRTIAEDLLSFSVADLSLTLERWDAPSERWTEVFQSDNAGENLEHIAQPISAGRYRLRVKNASTVLTPYGLAWRFDPYEPAIMRTLIDDQQISSNSNYTTTFAVRVSGRCVAVATPSIHLSSPGIGLLLERDLGLLLERDLGGGSWTTVCEMNGLYSKTDFFSTPVVADTYRITVTSGGPDLHGFEFSYRIDPDLAAPIDQQALLTNLTPDENDRELGHNMDSGTFTLEIRVPQFLHEETDRYLIEHSTDLQTWLPLDTLPATQNSLPLHGHRRLNWDLDTQGLPTHSYFRATAAPAD